MFNVNDIVEVLEPFKTDFPDVYRIEEIITHDDGQVVYILETAGGFDAIYLRKAQWL